MTSLPSIVSGSKRAAQALAIMSSFHPPGRKKGGKRNRNAHASAKKVSRCLHMTLQLMWHWPESSPVVRKAKTYKLYSGRPCARHIRSPIPAGEGGWVVCHLMCATNGGDETSPHPGLLGHLVRLSTETPERGLAQGRCSVGASSCS